MFLSIKRFLKNCQLYLIIFNKAILGKQYTNEILSNYNNKEEKDKEVIEDCVELDVYRSDCDLYYRSSMLSQIQYYKASAVSARCSSF